MGGGTYLERGGGVYSKSSGQELILTLMGVEI